mgnify:CR=1 FL=1
MILHIGPVSRRPAQAVRTRNAVRSGAARHITAKLRWRHTRNLFESRVKGRSRIKPDIIGDHQNRAVRLAQLRLGIRNAVAVDEIKEAFADVFVQGLRYIIRRCANVGRQCP